MLNAQFFGAGMNLQMATDIIMYHRFTKEMEEQIIGRAQRLGRSINEPLNVYYLLHDNESNNIDDNFKFQDQENIHYLDWLEQQHINNNKQDNLDNENKIYTINMENSDIEKYKLVEKENDSIIDKFIEENNLEKNSNLSKIFIKNNEKINNIDDLELDNFEVIT